MKKINLSVLVIFLFIFLSAAAFRLTNLNLIEFKGDEAINLYLAARPLFGYPFPPGGTVSSIGLLNPPLLNYLLFPFVLISLDPKIVSFFIGLINSFSIGLFFLIVKRYYSLTTALTASFLFAFSPWSIIFSRKIWTQNLIIPLMVLVLFSLGKIVVKQQRKYWIPYLTATFFIIQLHQSTGFFLVLLNFFLFLQLKKNKSVFHLKYILAGTILGILPAFPFLIYLVKNLFTNPEAILVAKERFAPVFHSQIFLRPLQIINQGNFYFVLGQDTLTFKNLYPFAYNLRVLFYLEYLFIPWGMVVFWQKHPQWRFLIGAVLTLPFVYFLLHFEPFIHYFLVISLFLFLFLASSLSWLINSSRLFLKSAGGIIFTILIITSLIYNTAFFKLLQNQQGFKGDYGPVYSASAAEVKKRLLPYKDDPHYQEMFLASFLPIQYWYGYLPVPQMLYCYEETKTHLDELETRLKEVPVDARIQLELLAFWTQSPPTPETLSLLKEKAITIPGYQLIYQAASQF